MTSTQSGENPMPNNIVNVPPLPATNASLRTEFKPVVLREAVKAALMDGAYEVVQPYLNATDNAQSQTGGVDGDEWIGAQKMQQWAVDHDVDVIRKAKLREIKNSINAALRHITDDQGHPIDRRSRVARALGSQ
jgi:hypothetical protein